MKTTKMTKPENPLSNGS